jgi:hypothetical protein
MVRAICKEPPNHRGAECCGGCVHWEWGYEGEGSCKKYLEWRRHGPERLADHIYHAHATLVCDDFKAPEPKP